MFEHLITRAEIIEAKLAARMGKKADAIQKRYEGRKGYYLFLAFGFGYYLFSVAFLPLLTGSLIFLYLFLRYLLPVIYALFCISSLVSIDSYIVSSNMAWVSENARYLALRIFYPILSDQAIALLHIIVPTLIVSVVFISIATAIAVIYRKAVFADTVNT